jgi:hypothetical protein
MSKRTTRFFSFVFAAALAPSAALAWGTTGHREVNLDAALALPPAIPAFLRTPRAVAEIETLGPEMDRLKGAGTSWDKDYDPGHFVDIGDDGAIVGSVRLDALPQDVSSYAKALAASGSDPYRTGYLPYAIADGWEQVRMDFAYWRAFDYLATHAAQPDARASFAAARDLREALTIRDVGVWGHFVGDGSQPLHVTVHYDGWGKFPNPSGYTTERIHSAFEGAFVRDHVTAEAVAHLVPAASPAAATALLTQAEVLATIGTYLEATASTVPTLYQIEKRGGFERASPEAVTFTTARVAAGAQELRDLVVAAWENSAYASVGYPEIRVTDILDGSVTPAPSAFGGD